MGANIEVGQGEADGTDSFAAGFDAARQAVSSIKEHAVSVVLVFASVRYDLEEMLKGVRQAIPGAPILGTTTAGEICGGVRSGSVVVLVLASPYITVSAGVGENVSSNWEAAVLQAVSAPGLSACFGAGFTEAQKKMTLEGRQAFGLIFSPGNTRHSDSRSFEIFEKLKQLSQNRLSIFGGASADDWRMETNFALFNGKAFKDSLLVAVFETGLQFGMAFHHGFTPGPEQVTITRSEGREIRELNGRPAAEVLSGLPVAPVEALEGKHLTFTGGRFIGVSDPYGGYSISAASFITPGGGVRVSRPVPRGTVLTFMEGAPDNIIAAGQEAFRKASARGNVERPAAIIVFSCAVRRKLLGERIEEEISSIVKMAPDVPLAGFYSFGEQGLSDEGVNRHDNGAITTLVIGADLSYAARVASENIALRQQMEQVILDLETQQKTVREAEKKYRAIFENAREGIYQSTPEGRYLNVNPAMAKMYGYASPEEMISQVRSIGRDAYVNPQEREELIRRIAEQSEIGDFEVEQRRKDGSTFLASLIVHAVRGKDGRTKYWEGRCIDITARKHAEERVRQSENNYRQLFELPHDGMVLADLSGRVLAINRACCEQTGRSLERLIGSRLGDFESEASRAELPSRLRTLEIEGEAGFDIEIIRPDGAMVFCEVRARLVDWFGQKAILGLSRDMSERKRMEEDLLARNEELARFVYTVSHDLKSPLVTIQAFLGYLVQDLAANDQERVRADLGYIDRASVKMRDLLDGLLELSRVGRKMNPPEDFLFVDLVRSALDTVAGQIARRGVKIDLAQVPVIVHGDRLRLTQVFQNLIDNAVKFMGDQGEPRIEIGVDTTGAEPVFHVRDNGSGIDPRHMGKLFGLFEKLQPSVPGNGMGLALIKRIIEVHGGKIWAESDGPGRGATFRFTLQGTKSC